ncbi:hypothetical protein [Roseomonas indoligenes]|uniref:Uncharacterized protein n=1 Tax=Roseomonas indoligenes TaxID=2820811 RepID=A0A940S5L5_9PROT|nr:hypothetical protein [Pararoseomonas indoligenes]MBP0494546.1 hypothetical protein [Pararoseomonas indoligenes]
MKQPEARPLLSLDQSSVEDLDAALRLYRRLPLELLGFLVLLFAGMVGLSRLSTALSPPYGVYILGWDLVTWGLLLMIALLFGLLWWRGRQVGQLLNDPAIMASPVMSLPAGIGVIAERAKAMDMEWSGFFGPLRPRRNGR